MLNGFTYNPQTRAGTFHVINSWADLWQFDLDLKAAGDDVLRIEASVSPKGETPMADEPVRATVKRLTLIRTAGKLNLYEVETDLWVRKIAAQDEAAARALAEAGD